VLGYDVTHDIALLQMKGVSGLTTVSLGNSSGVGVGDAVVAIGNALGAGGTPAATSGAVSALSQTITAGDTLGNSETLSGLIELTAPIQPGDSGGPLVDTSGKAIGIDTAAMTGRGYRQASVSTAAYAIPINTALAIAQQIQSGTSSATVHIGQRAILGVQVQDGTGSAVGVIGVETGSPAASAGLAAGSTIVSVDGTGASSAAALGSILQGHRVGDWVSVTWLDVSGTQHSTTLALIAGPPA
jgi:S1-C subfamily serine protease